MIFSPVSLEGAFILDPEPIEDSRGAFARTWCEREARDHGLNPRIAQVSLSRNLRAGTLRGMHYQRAPHAECKLVRCVRGALYDVIVDLRQDSPTFGRWEAFELTWDNGRQIYIPEGFAHGFQTLADGTDVLYQMSEFHHPESAAGFRWNDPAFGIQWPRPDPMLSPRDAGFPDFRP